MSQSPPPPVEDGSDRERLPPSDRHALLASARRRAALDALADMTPPIHLAHLARAVAVHEAGGRHVDGEQTQQVALVFHHHHLPKLVEHGVVAYDRDAKLIEPVKDRLALLRD